MRKTLLLGATILQLGFTQISTAQTTKALGDNFSRTYQKEIALDPLFLTGTLDTIIDKITAHHYDQYTYKQLIKSLLRNPEMQEQIAIYQLNNPNIQRASSDPFSHQAQIIRLILLQKGCALRASSENGFASSHVLSVSNTSGKDMYIQSLLPTIVQYDEMHIYHINDSTSQIVATPIVNTILVNDCAANAQYKDVMVSHPELNGIYTHKNFTESLYANEKLHIYEGMHYGDRMTNKDTVDCDGVAYTRREISEMWSDYISLEHDPRYIYAIIHNMIYDDIASQEVKENNIQAKYSLSQNILRVSLQEKGYILIRSGNKYYITKTQHAVLSGSNEQGIANYIYTRLSITDINQIITIYRQQAILYKTYLDAAYRAAKQSNKD